MLKKKKKLVGIFSIELINIQNYKRDVVLRKYMQGKISISKAAEDTGLTIGEIEDYMVKKGYRSTESTADMEREMELLSEGSVTEYCCEGVCGVYRSPADGLYG